MPAPAATRPARAKAMPTAMTSLGKVRNAFMSDFLIPCEQPHGCRSVLEYRGWERQKREEATTLGGDSATLRHQDGRSPGKGHPAGFNQRGGLRNDRHERGVA